MVTRVWKTILSFHMSYCLNFFPAHCKEKIFVIAPLFHTCSFFIPTEENMPGIQLPMAGEVTDLNCLFPKLIQFLAVFHPNLSLYPQIRVSLSSHKVASFAAAGDRPTTDPSA